MFATRNLFFNTHKHTDNSFRNQPGKRLQFAYGALHALKCTVVHHRLINFPDFQDLSALQAKIR